MPYVIVSLLLFDGFFGQFFPNSYGYIAYLAGFLLVGLWFVTSPDARHPHVSKIWLGWMLVAALAFVSHITAAGFQTPDVFLLTSAVFLALLASSTTRWIRPAMTIVLLFSSVHVFATIAFYIRPELYGALIAGRFFLDAPMAIDYTSALTTHYSRNALLCVLALLTSAAWVMASRHRRVQVCMAGIALASFFALVLTTKRAHLLIAVLAIVIGVASSNLRGRFFKLTFGAIVAVVAVFASARAIPGIADSLDRVLGSFRTDDLTELTSGRTLLWDFALSGWADKPLFGNGWATYFFVWPNGTQTSTHAHNLVVNGLYEVGIVGTTLVVLVVVATAFAALKLRGSLSAGSGVSERVGSYFAVMLQVFFVVYSFTTGELLRSNNTFIPYILAVAVALALGNDVRDRRRLGLNARSTPVGSGKY